MAEAPSQPQHPRRGANPHDGKRLVNQPGYFWSTSITSKALVSEVLPLVLDQLVLAAKKYGQELHEDDIAWLTEHKGRFEKYLHPKSTEFGTILRSPKYKKLNDPLLIKEAVLTNRHTVVAESPRIANTDCSANYANSREMALAQLWNFLAITKDYDSMLILLGHPFENSPSVKFSSYQSFVLHKYNPQWAPLKDSWSGGAPVLDWLGRQVLSEGSVNNDDTFYVLVSALNDLHPKFAKGGNEAGQTDPCAACYASYKTESDPSAPSGVGQYTPCTTHTDSPCRYCCRGNPYYKSCSLLTQLVSYLNKETARREYKPKSKDPLLRSDFLDIHALVKAHKFKLWDFAMFTMLLGGVYYAGRFDSYSDVKLEDFSKVSGHFSIHNNFILHLAQQVFGKSDKVRHTYLLFFDNHCPELCYLRHLLVFAHCTILDAAGEDTHLFPRKQTLISRQADSNGAPDFTGGVSYLEGRQWLSQMAEDCLDNSSCLDLGMDSLRVTFYLWSVLAGTDSRITKNNARHKSDGMAEKCIANSEIILSKLKNNPALLKKQRLGPPGQNLLVLGKGNQTRRLDLMNSSNNNVSSLAEAAKIFVENMLNVPSDHPRYRDANFLMELSYEKRFSLQSPEQDLQAALESLPKEHQARMRASVSSFFSKVKPIQPLPCAGEPHATGLSAGASQPFFAPGLPLDHCPTPRRLVFLKELESDPAKYELSFLLHKFSNKTQEEQALFLYNLVQEVLTLGKNVNQCEPASRMTLREQRNFVVAQHYRKGKSFIPKKANFCRIVDPFFECLHACHNGDFAALKEDHSKVPFKYSKFKGNFQPHHACCGMLVKCWSPAKESGGPQQSPTTSLKK
jgi:hypothetical protein